TDLVARQVAVPLRGPVRGQWWRDDRTGRRRAADPRDVIDLVLVERVFLQHPCGQPTQAVPVLVQEPHRLPVALLDDPADFLVEEPRGLLAEMFRWRAVPRLRPGDRPHL